MHRLVSWLCVCALFCLAALVGCRAKQSFASTQIHDTIRQADRQTARSTSDTVFLFRYIKEQALADTIRITDYVWRDRVSMRTDTLMQHDTLRIVEYRRDSTAVEKNPPGNFEKLSWWQRLRLRSNTALLFICLAETLLILFYIILKLKKF